MGDSGIAPWKDRLRQERIAHNWRQRDVAERLETTVLTVYRWERGDQQPSVYFRAKLCALFEKSPEDLGLIAENTLSAAEAQAKANASLEEYPTPTLSIHIPDLWSVPYPRNSFFTGREAILRQLHETLGRERSLAISGLAGIGKTQTALEYVYRYGQEYTAIFWIGAETAENFTRSLSSIAEALHLQVEQEYNRVIAAVMHWLTKHEEWLLVFDNVEDLEIVKPILPSSSHGSLLFTSRRQAFELSPSVLNLDPLTREEGLRLLAYRARRIDRQASPHHMAAEEVAAARALVGLVDGHPLALDQAGAYIAATCCSLRDYLQLFQSSQVRMLDERDAHSDHSLSVTRTFKLAFAHLEQSCPSATELLTVCAYLAPEAIPETFLLRGARHLGQTFEELAIDPILFNRCIKELLTYSLLQRDPVTHTLRIHRLVQTVLKGSQSEAVGRKWAQRVKMAMSHLFPSSDEELQEDYWQICEQLLPHALVCVTLWEQDDEDEADRILFLCHLAGYLVKRARYKDAESLLQQALHRGTQVLGSEHPHIAYALHGLADLYREQGKYQEAEPLFQQAWQMSELSLGTNHPLLAYSIERLALIYWEQGKYEQAELLYQRVLQIRLGADPLRLAEIFHGLALLLSRQGKCEQAEVLYERVLQIREQRLGPMHPQLAYPLRELALLYCEQGKYEQAETLYERALRVGEQALGSEHPQVAWTLRGLADVYLKQKKYEQAETFYRRALQIGEQTWGFEHPLVAHTLHGLANLARAQNSPKKAEQLYRQAINIQEQTQESVPLYKALFLYDLAILQEMQGKHDEALSLYTQVLHIRNQVLGTEHATTRETRQRLEAVSQVIGEAEETIEHEKCE